LLRKKSSPAIVAGRSRLLWSPFTHRTFTTTPPHPPLRRGEDKVSSVYPSKTRASRFVGKGGKHKMGGAAMSKEGGDKDGKGGKDKMGGAAMSKEGGDKDGKGGKDKMTSGAMMKEGGDGKGGKDMLGSKGMSNE